MLTVKRGIPYPLGANRDRSGINFSFVTKESDAGVIIYDKDGKQIKERISFPEEYAVGNIRCMNVEGLSGDVVYAFYEKESVVRDERGRAFLGCYEYGEKELAGRKTAPALICTEEYDWGGDKKSVIPYAESIVYCLHVRGFTRHPSSKVKGKGTFLGIQEKIPYLKDLGITTVEFQPVYEFPEVEKCKEHTQNMPETIMDQQDETTWRSNYWGYTKGCYYSPKSSYAHTRNAAVEFKNLVKEFHRNGMEVVLQFYFTEEMQASEILDILRFWVMEYHVDGFHLKGAGIDSRALAMEPALAKTKLWYYGFDVEAEQTEGASYLAEYTEDFRYDMRSFLKGDGDMIPAVMRCLRHNPPHCGKINYMSNYDGFTLMDMVCFDKKHNEDNGEGNRDGTDYNASWNCGIEGPSKKKHIVKLRRQQLKNALLMLYFAQGTPLIFMGDEFGNSQKGNNNPYCQDNEITWLNWKNKESNSDIYDFIKEIIRFRKEHPVFWQKKELRGLDYNASGFPDISYHGQFPWKPDLGVASRQLCILYNGTYAGENASFYIAYNMHWEEYTFELPTLKGYLPWEVCIFSGEILPEVENRISLPARTICILCAKKGKDDENKNEDRTAF